LIADNIFSLVQVQIAIDVKVEGLFICVVKFKMTESNQWSEQWTVDGWRWQ